MDWLQYAQARGCCYLRIPDAPIALDVVLCLPDVENLVLHTPISFHWNYTDAYCAAYKVWFRDSLPDQFKPESGYCS